VERTRDVSWIAMLAAIAGLIMFGVMLFGATQANALPVAPIAPTDVANVPTADPLPPKPPTCKTGIKCQPPTLEPCFQLPGKTCEPPCGDIRRLPCNPPTLTPCKDDCQPPSSEPTKPSEPTDPSTKVATPTNPPTTDPTTSIPTPNRIDTGEGFDESPNWVLLGVPALVLLTIVAGGSIWWMRRSEARR
jgi:hypothetical protein